MKLKLNGKGYLKLTNASKYLDMSVKTFRKHVLPYISYMKIGNRMYFSIKELDRFMEEKASIREKEINQKVEKMLKKVFK